MLTDVGPRGAVVIVTGAGSGIGAATARQLGTVGAPVVLVGRREAPLKVVAGQIADGGGEALCVPADLADPASPQRIADACLDRYGRIDGLVNNAAWSGTCRWPTGTPDASTSTSRPTSGRRSS